MPITASLFLIILDKFEDEIDALLAAYDGVNVTIPYKLPVIAHLKNIVDPHVLELLKR